MCDRFEGEAAGAWAEAADRRHDDRHREGDEGEDRVDATQIEQKADDEARQRRRQPAPLTLARATPRNASVASLAALPTGPRCEITGRLYHSISFYPQGSEHVAFGRN